MNEDILEIGGFRIVVGDVRKCWIDYESEKERKSRRYYQENNYLGSAFGLLVAGLVDYFLSRKSRHPRAKKYLHIKTGKDEYCFSEDEADINEILGRLNK
ncbi:hypothetical protein [Jeongeupia chitinilytica]|uniref:Uncharacterized protein n=1 Tax=Jeongeupia chitinilytica TaxID=1041641 RepID=A0ABQ3H0I9_9NEIS|nr:hypothetical protein [Jeongeupia chitinilytica]GHD62542.1 hypothetical protein GCM10007350_18720 [Jeongeupia chitinilytica]